jgi:hypothetical protein
VRAQARPTARATCTPTAATSCATTTSSARAACHGSSTSRTLTSRGWRATEGRWNCTRRRKVGVMGASKPHNVHIRARGHLLHLVRAFTCLHLLARASTRACARLRGNISVASVPLAPHNCLQLTTADCAHLCSHAVARTTQLTQLPTTDCTHLCSHAGASHTPAVHPSVLLLPTFNSMAMFTVQPGKSFHSVQVCVRVRVSCVVDFAVCRTPMLAYNKTWCVCLSVCVCVHGDAAGKELTQRAGQWFRLLGLL